jgi:CO/xanthine dehydrogenase FAD-binding subunit
VAELEVIASSPVVRSVEQLLLNLETLIHQLRPGGPMIKIDAYHQGRSRIELNRKEFVQAVRLELGAERRRFNWRGVFKATIA